MREKNLSSGNRRAAFPALCAEKRDFTLDFWKSDAKGNYRRARGDIDFGGNERYKRVPDENVSFRGLKC